jgi:hypothetical protein
MKHRSTIMKAAVASVSGIALAAAGLTTSATASGAYNVTVAGFGNMTPLVALATSSKQPVVATNLPANVGIYALHCAVPANPRSAPTLCDSSADSLVYIPAIPTARDRVEAMLKVNGEFYGTNPNPQAGTTAPASVDCRATTAPGTSACAVYIIGAGRESANPAYLRVFPTVFSAVKADRKTDSVKVTPRSGSTVTQTPSAFEATTASGLIPTITSTQCSFLENNKKVQALASSGTCEVLITTTGGRNFKPLVQKITYNLG